MSKTIGFIGTGLMGGPMVRNLLAAGYREQYITSPYFTSFSYVLL